jgi:hypothetical protein
MNDLLNIIAALFLAAGIWGAAMRLIERWRNRS